MVTVLQGTTQEGVALPLLPGRSAGKTFLCSCVPESDVVDTVHRGQEGGYLSPVTVTHSCSRRRLYGHLC